MLAATATLNKRKPLIELTQRLVISLRCQKQGQVVSDSGEAESAGAALAGTFARHPASDSLKFTNTAVLVVKGPKNPGADHSTGIRHCVGSPRRIDEFVSLDPRTAITAGEDSLHSRRLAAAALSTTA